MNYWQEWKRCYRLLRQGDACRQGCTRRLGQRNGFKESVLVRTEKRPDGSEKRFYRDITVLCDECNNKGWKNRRSPWQAFRGAFGMVKNSLGFRVGIAAFEDDNRISLFAEERRHTTHMNTLHALELYRVRHPNAEITDFNALPAEVRREYMERAQLPSLEFLEEEAAETNA